MSQTLQQVLAILDCYLDGPPAWGVSELGRRLRMHKSRVHRAVKTFEAAGYMKLDPATAKYRLGIKLFELGKVVERDLSWRDDCRQLLVELSRKTNATVLLRVLEGLDNVVVAAVENPGPLRITQPVGTRSHCCFGAGGKLLMAHLPEPRLKEVLASIDLPQFTAKTVTNEARLFKELQVIRGQGFASSDEEAIAHVRGLAVPVLGSRGEILCALVVGLPTPECPKERFPGLLETMRVTSEKISRLIGSMRQATFPV